MAFILVKTRRQTKDGKIYPFYALRENYWDSQAKATRQRHIIYVGTKPEITESRARELAQRISEKTGRRITVEDLRKVRRLRIVPDEG